MNIFYKINLHLNLLKYSIKFLFKNEDKFIQFLKKNLKKKKGVYIDVGCYHPIRLSNTKFLYEKGWKGINIDISDKSIHLFKMARKNDINLNLGIGNKKKLSNSYFQKDLFATNTLDYKHSKKFLKKPIKKKIKVVTLDSVINKYVKNENIDFIDIDCEGKDLEALQGLNLSMKRIYLLSIEMHEYDAITKKKSKLIFDIMKKNKFKKIYGKYPGTLIFKNFTK